MRRAFAIFGAALLVALGLLMPRLTAAIQERGLAADVRRMENAAVSLTLAQEMVELMELDLFQSLELFSSPVTMVELEEGRYTSAEGAALRVSELATLLPADVYLEDDKALPTEAIPFLLTDGYGRSGIFWRCGWEERPDEAVWIDDQNQCLAGFCLRVSSADLNMHRGLTEDMCQAIFDRFFPPDVVADVFWTDDRALLAGLHRGEDGFVLPVSLEMEYIYFNIQFDTSAETVSIAE